MLSIVGVINQLLTGGPSWWYPWSYKPTYNWGHPLWTGGGRKNIIRIYGGETHMFQNVTIQLWQWEIHGIWKTPMYGGLICLSWTMIHKWLRPLRCLIPGGYWPCDATAMVIRFSGAPRVIRWVMLSSKYLWGCSSHKNVGFTKKKMIP